MEGRGRRILNREWSGMLIDQGAMGQVRVPGILATYENLREREARRVLFYFWAVGPCLLAVWGIILADFIELTHPTSLSPV